MVESSLVAHPLLRLLMRRMFLAPLAELFELQSFLNGLLILLRMMGNAFALGALELNEIVLTHTIKVN